MGMAQCFLLVLWFGWWVTSRSPRWGPAFNAASRPCYGLPSTHRLRRVVAFGTRHGDARHSVRLLFGTIGTL